MFQVLAGHWYRLEAQHGGRGIYCGTEGAFVGSVPLLERIAGADHRAVWSPRALKEIDSELSQVYGLPIDFSAKTAGLGAVARALNSGDVATAQAAMLNLHLPDLQALGKSELSDERIAELLVEFYFSELLPDEVREQIAKFDPRLHPRWPAGTENSQGGRFRPNDGNLLLPVSDQKERDNGEPPTEGPKNPPTKQEFNRALRRQSEQAERQVRAGLKSKGEVIGEFLNRLGVGDAMADAFIRFLTRFNDPETLDELIQLTKDPSRQHAGYERHHIVEQGPNKERFTKDQLESDQNVIAIPYYKHRDISDWYSTPNADYGGLTPRDFVRGKSFEDQYQFGLDVLRKHGVLK